MRERENGDYFIENIFALHFTTFYLNIAPLNLYSYVFVRAHCRPLLKLARLFCEFEAGLLRKYTNKTSQLSVASRGGQFNTDTCARCIHAHTQAPAQ